MTHKFFISEKTDQVEGRVRQQHLPVKNKLLARTRFHCPVLRTRSGMTDALIVIAKEMKRFSDRELENVFR